jgi:hypothetical protein
MALGKIAQFRKAKIVGGTPRFLKQFITFGHVNLPTK